MRHGRPFAIRKEAIEKQSWMTSLIPYRENPLPPAMALLAFRPGTTANVVLMRSQNHATLRPLNLSKVIWLIPRCWCGCLLSCWQIDMLKASKPHKQGMVSLTNHENGRCARWCALVILLAVCSLTISVATRYNSSANLSPSAAKSLQRHTLQEPGRQRLTKIAPNWMPVFSSSVLQAPSAYPRIAPAGPPIPRLSFESNLYNRPPPPSLS